MASAEQRLMIEDMQAARTDAMASGDAGGGVWAAATDPMAMMQSAETARPKR